MFQRKESENNIKLFLLLSSITNCASCSNERTHEISYFALPWSSLDSSLDIIGDFLSPNFSSVMSELDRYLHLTILPLVLHLEEYISRPFVSVDVKVSDIALDAFILVKYVSPFILCYGITQPTEKRCSNELNYFLKLQVIFLLRSDLQDNNLQYNNVGPKYLVWALYKPYISLPLYKRNTFSKVLSSLHTDLPLHEFTTFSKVPSSLHTGFPLHKHTTFSKVLVPRTPCMQLRCALTPSRLFFFLSRVSLDKRKLHKRRLPKRHISNLVMFSHCA